MLVIGTSGNSTQREQIGKLLRHLVGQALAVIGQQMHFQ